MRGYDIILLDADQTLFDFHLAERGAFLSAMGRLGLPGEELLPRYVEINEGLWRALERGEITQETLKIERFRLLFAELGVSHDPAACSRVYLNALGDGCYLLPGAQALCEALAAAGRRLYIATNGIGAVQRRRLACSAICAYIDDIFISEELGSHKPEPDYFDKLFARLGDPDRGRAILLGDSIASDMRGGRAAGIATCWLNPAGLPCPEPALCDYEIRALEGFLPIALGQADG